MKFDRPFQSQVGANEAECPALTTVLREAELRINVDGQGPWLDNIFIERIWRSLKCESVYFHPFETGSDLKTGLGRWITDNNTQRPHPVLAGRNWSRSIGATNIQIMDDIPRDA